MPSIKTSKNLKKKFLDNKVIGIKTIVIKVQSFVSFFTEILVEDIETEEKENPEEITIESKAMTEELQRRQSTEEVSKNDAIDKEILTEDQYIQSVEQMDRVFQQLIERMGTVFKRHEEEYETQLNELKELQTQVESLESQINELLIKIKV